LISEESLFLSDYYTNKKSTFVAGITRIKQASGKMDFGVRGKMTILSLLRALNGSLHKELKI